MRVLTSALGAATLTVNVEAQEHHVAHSTQSVSAEVTAFVTAARVGSERYRDRSIAIAAGFRRLGRDFPSMGEHWAHPGKVIAGRFDVADPPMLTYASIEGKPVLLGVVYAIPLDPGQHPPLLPGGVDAWHEHNGTVDEESFLPEHSGGHSGMHVGTRLAILHVWTLLPNPAGDFAAENWSLPFARLNLKPPASVPEPAARALSLLSGSEDFYSNLLESELRSERKTEWREALRAATQNSLEIVGTSGRSDTLSRHQLAALEKTWGAFRGVLSRQSPALARRLGGSGSTSR